MKKYTLRPPTGTSFKVEYEKQLNPQQLALNQESWRRMTRGAAVPPKHGQSGQEDSVHHNRTQADLGEPCLSPCESEAVPHGRSNGDHQGKHAIRITIGLGPNTRGEYTEQV